MASSRVVSSNSDLPQASSIHSISIPSVSIDHQSTTTTAKTSLPSVTMDDILKQICVDSDLFGTEAPKTANDVWKDIVSGNGSIEGGGGEPGMALEDFLLKTAAGVGGGEEVRVGEFGVMTPSAVVLNSGKFQQGVDGIGRRGKRKAVEEPVDKSKQQKQRRMIKNRESAARSRERKQLYTTELESQVLQLEEEREQLLREGAEELKRRHQWLIKNIIPVEEMQRPPRRLRRNNSMQW